jgi:hypothetical protein
MMQAEEKLVDLVQGSDVIIEPSAGWWRSG